MGIVGMGVVEVVVHKEEQYQIAGQGEDNVG